MNYFEKHIGDYIKNTAHLSMTEDGAYNRLIDLYYTREGPLPANLKECCKLARATSKPERDAVAYVLGEYFELREDGYHQDRCDEEIERYLESEPEREAKRTSERDRQRRSRERRKALFEQLRSHDVVPAWDTKTPDLEAQLSRVTNRDKSHTGHAPVTRDNTATQSPLPRHQTPELKHNPLPHDDDGTPISAPTVAVADWSPRDQVWRDLEFLHGVDEVFADLQLAEFKTFWRDKPPLTASAWDAKFLQRCADQWDRKNKLRSVS